MSFEYYKYKNIKGQLCYDESEVWVEISDDQNNAIGEIRRVNSQSFEFVIYKTNGHISLPVEDLLNLFQKAKSNI